MGEYRLSLKNITQKPLRSVLASLSITIGTASLILFLGLSNGIKNATFSELEKASPMTQITVQPKTDSGVVSLLKRAQAGKLNQEIVDKIAKIEGVEKIYPEIQFNNFASVEIDLLGLSLQSDTMVFGIPLAFIEKDIQKQDSEKIWNNKQEPYPVLIPRKILDLYNLTIAAPQNLPTISEERLLGKDIILYPNYSTFFPISENKENQIKLEVVGFSDKINFIGITLPFELVKDLNSKYGYKSNDNFLELFVETGNPAKTAEVAKKIEELGFNTNYFQKNLQDVQAKFKYLQISLGMISGIILLTAAIAIIGTFLATVAERTKEIGLFRALGANKTQIKKIILIEAGIIGLTGSIIGILMGKASSLILDQIALKQLENTTFSPETLFQITPNLIIWTLFFGTLLSIFAAYLPAQKASNINPIEALNRS